MYELCVMGNPIEQSKSPFLHSAFAAQFGIQVNYTKILPALDRFSETVMTFKTAGGYGLNVTSPFKNQAFELCTKTSERAAIAESVNTILFLPDGVIYGDNTDGIGFIRDITQHLQYQLTKKTIVLLGAGGAIQGLLKPILDEQPAKVIIANRTEEKAIALANKFKVYGHIVGGSFSNLSDMKADVVIDGTGFNAELPVPETFSLSKHSLCYDLKYNSPIPFFKQWAQKQNAHLVVDGLGMFVEQGAEAFYIWTQQKPNVKPVIQMMKELFYPKSGDH